MSAPGRSLPHWLRSRAGVTPQPHDAIFYRVGDAMTPENSKKPIRRGGLQLHPLQVFDRVGMVIKLPISVGAEVRWCEHAASSKLGMLLGRRREHLGSKFRPLRVIENGVQLATANHPSQTIHVSLARSRHCLWTPSEFVLNGHGASNVLLWPIVRVQ